ncbi:hypothetical protein Pfo_000213 [Paulownia fortunei]|nr:hypothetical protein Pfo_000213 [Paulownia fortunei]
MPGLRGSGSVPSLPPPRPKSPPGYPDLYGKRRELAKVQVLEREIVFLEEEVKSVEGLQPASRSCKEIADFVMCNADPLMPTGVSCFNVSRICCCRCSSHLVKPRCDDCTMCGCSKPCVSCRMPNCNCFSCWNSQCFNKSTCSWNCCAPNCPSCLTCSSIRCRCYPKFPKGNMCSCCNKSCCYSCYFCYWCKL